MNQALAGVAALAFAAVTLAACDQAPQPPASQTAAQEPCDCTQGAQPEPAAPQGASVVVRASRHAHRWAWRETWRESEIWRESERTSSSYEHESAVGSSDVEERVDDGERAADEGHTSEWVDGYGRRHVVFARDEHDARSEALGSPDERKRLDPWHGYDATCDER